MLEYGTMADLGTPSPFPDPILSFSHTFSPKRAHVGGRRPLQLVDAPTGNPDVNKVCNFQCDQKFYIIKNSISKVNHIILLFLSAEEDI